MVLLTLGLLFMGMAYSPEIEDLTYQLKLKTMEVLQLREQISDLRLQVANYRQQRKDDLIALEPAVFASESGNGTSLYLRNPNHLKNVWKWVKQYRHLLTPEAEATAKDFNIEFFVFSWAFKESHFNPFAMNKNKNGSYDWGMCQINDVCWDGLYAQLPTELKKRRNPKQDAELSICMIYLWINSRVKGKMSYCFLSDEGWTLVYRLNVINKREG